MSGAANMAQMEMKKGKANVPPQMRGQYARQQEMQSMREDMEAASKPGKDGLPVFNLFVRTPRANMVRRASKPFSVCLSSVFYPFCCFHALRYGISKF